MKKHTLIFLSIFLSSVSVVGSNGNDITIRVAKYKGDKDCAISYTFDDGYVEHYTLAAPELERHGFRGTFWVIGNAVNEDENRTTNETRMTRAELKEMSDNGHEISNHSWSHPNFTRIGIDEVKREIQRTDTLLYEITGVFPRTFCYPYNARNEEVLELASKDRAGTRTKQLGIGTKITPERFDEIVNGLLENGEWGVEMIHGITYGYDAFAAPSVLWDHLEKVKAMEDKIWVGTFREVASYIRQQEDIRLHTVSTKNGYCITPQPTLDNNIFMEPLTMVVEIGSKKKVSAKQGKKKLPFQVADGKMLFDFDPYGEDIYLVIK